MSCIIRDPGPEAKVTLTTGFTEQLDGHGELIEEQKAARQGKMTLNIDVAM